MDKELERAIKEVIEATEAAAGWASRETRLDTMELFCAVYQLKRVYERFIKDPPKTKRNRKIA
jgi:hypothetical protein